MVYTTTDGDEIKKSHGDIVLKLAKSHDAERKKTARLEAEKDQSSLEKRADEELEVPPRRREDPRRDAEGGRGNPG